jgi:hypothetical protein
MSECSEDPVRISNYDREMLVRRIGWVKYKSCHMEILELIHNTEDFPYTINNNGVFFNLAVVSEESIRKITAIVAKWEQRKRRR